jgi:hypothetical protein
VSDSTADRNKQARGAVRRVVEVARRGQACLDAYRQETVALGTWLRSHLFRQGSKSRQTRAGQLLRRALAARRLQERQQVYRNGGGGRSSSAARALRRAAEAVRHKNG